MTNRWRRALAAPSGLFLLAVLAAGLAAPLLPLADPTAIDISSKFLPPSLEHPFGTDLLGRDMLSRMIWGIRTTFVTALLTMIVTAGVGMIAGGAAAAARGRVDALIMRFCDVWMSFPSEVLILALVGMMDLGHPHHLRDGAPHDDRDGGRRHDRWWRCGSGPRQGRCAHHALLRRVDVVPERSAHPGPRRHDGSGASAPPS